MSYNDKGRLIMGMNKKAKPPKQRRKTDKIRRFNNKVENGKGITVILGLIIMVQLLVIVYNFAFVKVGYHGDELWIK